MLGFEITPWRITGSAGGSLIRAFPIGKVGAGGSYARIKLRNERTKQNVTLHCVGIVGTAAIGVSPPVSFDGSLPIFPSGGIGKIVATQSELKVGDFGGRATIISAICKGIGGGQLSLILFKSVLPSIPKVLSVAEILRLVTAAKAVGLYAGVIAGTSIQALGAEAGEYFVSVFEERESPAPVRLEGGSYVRPDHPVLPSDVG